MEKLIAAYVLLFARPKFEKFNKLLYRLSLGGLGILNHKTSKISGEKAFLKKHLTKSNCVLIDVGANEGNYTLDALSICKTLKIYAFEPHPITFSNLTRNVSHHSNVTPINKGMSASNGVLTLYDYANNDGSSHASLFQDVIVEIHGADSTTLHDIELTTLDDFMAEKHINEVALLKIDTEGNELEVLKGGAKAIAEKRIKAIHFEFNEMNVASRVFFRDFWKLLDSYKLYRLLPDGMLEIKTYTPFNCEIFAYQNIVAILKDS